MTARRYPGRMRHRRLAREIAIVLTAKLVLLSLIYALCFSPAHRVDPAAGIARMFSTPVQG